MKLDSTDSLSAANEAERFSNVEGQRLPDGNRHTEPILLSGSEKKQCLQVGGESENNPMKNHSQTTDSWCYLFTHCRRTSVFEEKLKTDGRVFFIHKSVKYVRKYGRGVKETTTPTVSGLIFLQGQPKEIQNYLNTKFPGYWLCKNCSTGKPAVIPHQQMEPFMRIAEVEPDRIRFLMRPFQYYAKNRTLLRIASGNLAGLEGYVIRMARDRRLVMDVGGKSIAISGIHNERFEEVGKNETHKKCGDIFYKRNLQERNAFIDRYFHPVTSESEVAAQKENIEILRLQILSDEQVGKINVKEAFASFAFMIEEIGYYYAPFFQSFGNRLQPLFAAGTKVFQEMRNILSDSKQDEDFSAWGNSVYADLKTNYAYLFDEV